MPAFDSAQASASTGTVSDRVLLDALVVVAARRLVLGVDVAAAKFLSGQRVDDLVREQAQLCANSESFVGMRPTSRCARCTEPFVFLPPPILAA